MKKWKDDKGASLLLALLLFLLCAGGGAAVLALASGATGSIARLSELKQEQFTLSSGARLLRDELEEQVCRGYRTLDEEGNTGKLVFTREPGGNLGEILMTGVRQVKETGRVCRLTWTMEVSGQEEQGIEAEFTMDREYQINVILRGERLKYYLQIPAASSQEEEGQESFSVIWSRGVIRAGKEQV